MLQRPTHTLSALSSGRFYDREILVAVVVFAVGLLAIGGMQTQSISQSTFSEQRTMRVNAITNQAETLIRLPVQADTTNNVRSTRYLQKPTCANTATNGRRMCDKEDDKPYKIRQRVVQGYPLPNLAMIELEVIPTGVTADKAEKRTVRIAYVRSLRWN